jgi:hypothetical protein
MTLAETLALLKLHNALIVHCAGMAKGVGSPKTAALGYLERLECAAQNKFELSCSTVVPNDECSFDRMNYTGQVGLVLLPSTAESVTFASPTDAGSQIDPNCPGRRTHNCGPVSLHAIDSAISRRPTDKYNELGLYQFSVVGVFVDPPVQYSDEVGFHDVSVDEVALRFPSYSLFCLQQGVLHTYLKEGNVWQVGTPVPMTDIYD